jgi:alkylation response protein AidB-like acyl-CoA dehydrogenase
MTMNVGTAQMTAGELDEFASTVRAYCRRRLPEATSARPGRIRDAAAARLHWQQMSEDLGLGALLIPEVLGGSGASLVEAGRAAEALGAELAPVPFLSAGVLAPTLLAGLAEDRADSLAGELLASIAGGEHVAAVAWASEEPGSPGAAPIFGSGVAPSQCFRYVIDADVADVILLVGAGGEQIGFARAGDVAVTPRVAFDLTRGLTDVAFDSTVVTALASGATARKAFQRMLSAGRLTVASESAGGAQAALEQAVEYARQRVQFGRQIGSFQAIKHILADGYVDAESALSTARLAIEAQVTEAPDAAQLLALAAFYCADKFADIAAADIQVHGGIGFTAESSAHLFRRRAESNRHLLGEPALLRADYVNCLAGKEITA